MLGRNLRKQLVHIVHPEQIGESPEVILLCIVPKSFSEFGLLELNLIIAD